MRYEVIFGIEKRPGMNYKCETGILGRAEIISSTLGKAKKIAMQVASKNPVMSSIILSQQPYPSQWLSEAVNENGRPFWSKLYTRYGNTLSYINLVELPPITNPIYLDDSNAAKINKKENVIDPSQASEYFIEQT